MTGRLPMTTGRRLALLIGVPLALALIALTAIDEVSFAGIGSYYVGLKLPVHGTAQLSVGSGDLTVGQAAGDRLLVTGKARYSLVRSTVNRRVAATVTSVSTQCEFPFGICDFHLQAGLPVGTRALLSDGSGDLTLRSLRGTVNATNGSGDIRGTRLASAVVTASAGSGDITLAFTQAPSRVTISDGSGDIHLIVPRGVAYHVTGGTPAGSMHVYVATNVRSPHTIAVSDGSGDILITH
jgi:hypothetical protein